MKTRSDKSVPNGTPDTEVHGKASKKKSGQKIARHSFTMPESEYRTIATLRGKLISAGVTAKNSDLIRIGIKELSKLSFPKLNKKLSKLYLNI